MSTLTLKNLKPTSFCGFTDKGEYLSVNLNNTVPLEDWYEELGEESLDPLNQLIAEEEEVENQPIIITKEEVTMSATTLNNKPAFDLNAWMNTLAVATDAVIPTTTKVIDKPEWLEIKGPLVASNAFAITAGVVKAARKITDGLFVAKNRHSVAVEALTIQEARAVRQTPLQTSFGPLMTNIGRVIAEAAGTAIDAPGFNPDGQEFDLAVKELEAEVEGLEGVIENGSNMMNTLLNWIDDVAVELHLEVETGHTVSKDLIGNTFRKPRYERLDRNTLMYGIAAQKEFIRNARN